MKTHSAWRIVSSIFLSLACIIVACPNARSQGVLYSQPFVDQLADPSSFSPYTAVYDDFTLAAGGTIGAVDWTGYVDLYASGGGVNGFTIGIWSDQGGLPGTLLADESVTGTANQTFVGAAYFNANLLIYNYSSVFSSPFQAAPGTTYLLSVVANGIAGSGYWIWATSSTGNFGAIDIEYGNVLSKVQLPGTAFSLLEAPEPSTLCLLTMGGVALCLKTLGDRRAWQS
jgi:hypothetical protein